MNEQLGLLRDSGLPNIGICLAAQADGLLDPARAHIQEHFPQVTILSERSPADENIYEGQTLRRIHKHVLEDCAVLYLHTKAVTWYEPEKGNDWRKLMEYFCVERWRDCVAKLEEYDCVGVNWMTVPRPHFAGNFWWARSDYLRTLGMPSYSHDSRHEYEMWIGSGNPKAYSFHQSNTNHYFKPYPREMYA